MIKYILKRLLLLIPVILGVSLVVFTLLFFSDGDPARQKLGQNASAEAVEAAREEMGLNDPFYIQYGRYIARLATLDMGESYRSTKPVIQEIMDSAPATFKLAAFAVTLAVLIGVPIGILSAIKQYSIFDNVMMIFALIGVSMPVFWLGLLLILFFSVQLGWFPPSGFRNFSQMVLPSVTLGAQSIAVITRMTRSNMLEVIRKDYIRTAEAKGQKRSVIIWRHALGNALIPIITIIGIQFGQLLSGALMTEAVFSIPGVGRLMIDAIKSRDNPVVLGSVIFVAVAFAIVNLIVDLLYAFVDPRIKSQYV